MGRCSLGESIASVASRPEAVSGAIAGDIADRSLQNFMPQLTNYSLEGTQITAATSTPPLRGELQEEAESPHKKSGPVSAGAAPQGKAQHCP